MTSYTLITFLGKIRSSKIGKSNRNEYDKVEYEFPDGNKVLTSYFANALINSGKYPIDQIFIIGTNTSMWDYLIEDCDENLQLNVIEALDNNCGVNSEHLEQIGNELQKKWHIPQVICQGVPSRLTENQGFEAFQQFNALLGKIYTDNLILLDFTHSFRWMPLLFISALQYKAALCKKLSFEKMKLIYGELRRDEPSPAIEFGDIRDGIQTAKAANQLFEKFDGKEIASIIESFWPEGSSAIKSLTVVIQFNMLTKYKGCMKRFKKAFNSLPEAYPEWFPSFLESLKSWIAPLLQENKARQLLALSEKLAENNFSAQAYLALDEAIIELVPEVSAMPEYDDLKDARNTLINNKLKSLKKKLLEISHIRNSIAHSGREFSNSKNKQWNNPSLLENSWLLHVEAVEGAIEIMVKER